MPRPRRVGRYFTTKGFRDGIEAQMMPSDISRHDAMLYLEITPVWVYIVSKKNQTVKSRGGERTRQVRGIENVRKNP